MIPISANNPSETTTLEAVKSLFDRWRRGRSTRSRIPEYLWEEVRQLTKQYTYKQITSELRITYQQLLPHLELDFPEDADVSPSPFVNARLPLLGSFPQHPEASTSCHAVLEIQGKDGMSLKATGVQPQDLIPLIQSFLNH